VALGEAASIGNKVAYWNGWWCGDIG